MLDFVVYFVKICDVFCIKQTRAEFEIKFGSSGQCVGTVVNVVDSQF